MHRRILRLSSLLSLLLSLLLLTTKVVVQAVTVSFDGDSWLNEASINQINGASTVIKIKGGTTSDKYGWLKFTISNMGSDAVSTAKLRIYNEDVNAQVKVYEADSWRTQNDVTWANYDGQMMTVLGRATPAANNAWFDIPLSPYHFNTNGDGSYAFVVTTESTDFSKNFISDNGGKTPQLILSMCDTTVSPGSLANINTALAASASEYDVVCLRAGIYTFPSPGAGSKINMKKGITLKGLGADPSDVVLDNAVNGNSWAHMLYDTDTQITDATFYNMEFRNIGIEVGTDNPALSVKNVKFDTCIFRLGLWQPTVNCGKGDHYIHFEAVDGGTVVDCQLYREAPVTTVGGNTINYHGRGITDQDSKGIHIVDNIIGGMHATEAESTGYFVTAINSKGEDSVIDGNHIFRNDEWNDATNTNLKDHGIYAIGFSNIKIENNVIGGWDVSAGGAGLKVRSGDGAKITSNTFHRSGIMLTVSGNSWEEAIFDGDSFLNEDEDKKDENYGDSTTIKLKGGTNTDKYGWFKFDVQNFGTIQDAKLSIWNDDVNSEVKVYEADNSKTESDVTWNNHGGQSTVLGSNTPTTGCSGTLEGYFDISLDETHFASGNGKYAFVVKTESSAASKNFISANGGKPPKLWLDDGMSSVNDLDRVYIHNNIVYVDPNTPEPTLSAWGGGIGLEKFKDHGQTGILIDNNLVYDGRIAVFGEQNTVDATKFNSQFTLFGTTYMGGITNNGAQDGYYITPNTINQSSNSNSAGSS